MAAAPFERRPGRRPGRPGLFVWARASRSEGGGMGGDVGGHFAADGVPRAGAAHVHAPDALPHGLRVLLPARPEADSSARRRRLDRGRPRRNHAPLPPQSGDLLDRGARRLLAPAARVERPRPPGCGPGRHGRALPPLAAIRAGTDPEDPGGLLDPSTRAAGGGSGAGYIPRHASAVIVGPYRGCDGVPAGGSAHRLYRRAPPSAQLAHGVPELPDRRASRLAVSGLVHHAPGVRAPGLPVVFGRLPPAFGASPGRGPAPARGG